MRQPDVAHGATVLRLADLPVLGDVPPAAPVVMAAAAGESEGWRRAALFTVEPGSGAAVPAGGTAPVAMIGTVTVAPGGGSALLFDDAAFLEVGMLADDMTPEGADDAALLRGANLCLAGRELIQFGRVAQVGPRAFRLSRLLRGRRGTEWAMGAHVTGESFLMIEEARLAAVPAEAVHAGAMLRMLAIGIGDAEPAEAEVTVTGEALIPPAPVHAVADGDGAGGWTVRWTRRSRAGWRWIDGVDVPLGEESERYVLRLMDGEAVVRSAESGTAAWQYTAAMMAEDGVAGPVTLEIRQAGTQAAGRAAMVTIG